MSIEKILQNWDGQLSCSRFDDQTGAFFTIAIHSQALGPAGGGTRAMQYAAPEAAVEDATRLAGAMTLKMVMADLPMGGGKSVIALPAPRHELSVETWDRILNIHAENLATLGHNYWTGPDVGTASADMDAIQAAGGHAFGRSEAAGGPGSSGPETAHGVHVAIHASIREAGFDNLEGKRVLIQGLGAVGYDVAERVAREGAHLIATDTDPGRVEQACRELGAQAVAPEDVLSTESDVFVPCATGGVIDEAAATTISTRAIAGGANNLLTTEAAADELHRRGIVLAPDFVVNAGGAIHLVGREVLGWDAARVSSHVEEIGTTLRQIFEFARTQNMSTDRAARRLAKDRLSASGALRS